jgi:hypothetical protein
VFTDLNASDLTFSALDYSQYSYGGDQVALRMLWNKGGNSGELRIDEMGSHIETFEFADGGTLDIHVGGNGPDSLIGTAGRDIFAAGSSNAPGFNYLYGYGGDDTYFIQSDGGSTYLGITSETASSGTADRVVFTDINVSDLTFGTLDYSALSYEGDQIALRIMWNSGGNSGELRLADMGSNIEAFQFADGTTYSSVDDFVIL